MTHSAITPQWLPRLFGAFPTEEARAHLQAYEDAKVAAINSHADEATFLRQQAEVVHDLVARESRPIVLRTVMAVVAELVPRLPARIQIGVPAGGSEVAAFGVQREFPIDLSDAAATVSATVHLSGWFDTASATFTVEPPTSLAVVASPNDLFDEASGVQQRVDAALEQLCGVEPREVCRQVTTDSGLDGTFSGVQEITDGLLRMPLDNELVADEVAKNMGIVVGRGRLDPSDWSL